MSQRCLIARKLDIKRTQVLLREYQLKLLPICDPASLTASDVVAQLRTGSLLFPGGTDNAGSALLFYDASQHSSKDFSKEQSIRTVLFLVELGMARHPFPCASSAVSPVLGCGAGSRRRAHVSCAPRRLMAATRDLDIQRNGLTIVR